MDWTWATLLLVAGLVLLAIAQFFMSGAKSRKNVTKLGIGIAVVGVFALWILPVQLAFLNAPVSFLTQTTVPSDNAPSTGVCPAGIIVDTTTVTLRAQDKYTSTATGGTHRYRINGAPATTVSDGSTFSASPGDMLEILWGNETSSSYYGAVSKEVVPCTGTKTFSTEMYANGTLTFRVFNEEGNIIDTSGENETLAAGDIVNLRTELQGTFQKGFPYGGIVVVEYNKTEIDDVIVQLGGVATTVPSTYSIALGTSSATKAYTVPAILSNQLLSGTIVIDADDSNGVTDAGDPRLTFYPYDYFVNEDTGGSFDGPASVDEDSTATFGHVTAYTISVD